MYVNIRLIIALHIQRLKDVLKVTAVLMKARNFEHSSANCFMAVSAAAEKEKPYSNKRKEREPIHRPVRVRWK
jgi:hypothetical protein